MTPQAVLRVQCSQTLMGSRMSHSSVRWCPQRLFRERLVPKPDALDADHGTSLQAAEACP